MSKISTRMVQDSFGNYFLPEQIPLAFNSTLPNCYIFDIDGTLALRGDRSPYDWSKVERDILDLQVSALYHNLQLVPNITIFIFSGRDEISRELTQKWLLEKGVTNYKQLVLRPTGNMEKDSVVKEAMYRGILENKFNVLGVIDDRPSVCRMWRSLGLKVFQVGDPDFEF